MKSPEVVPVVSCVPTAISPFARIISAAETPANMPLEWPDEMALPIPTVVPWLSNVLRERPWELIWLLLVERPFATPKLPMCR